MDFGNKTRTPRLIATLITFLAILTTVLLVQTPTAFGDAASYFYDDLGRLTRVVKGTSGVIYNYDEIGNLVSVVSATTANASPVITGINPSILFVGSTMIITITGQNLLTTDTVTSNAGLVAIDNVTVTDTQITAEMSALSVGSDTIKVTTRNGTPNTAQTGVTLTSSKLAFIPGQLAMVPGGSGSITVSIFPPLTNPLTINLNSSNAAVAIAPQSITIPTSGSQDFTVNALQMGTTTIGSGGLGAVVSVGPPFSGDVNGLAAGSISVIIDAPAGTSTRATVPVSVAIDAASGDSTNSSNTVSVVIDAASGNSTNTANAVSVSIDAPTGNSITTASPVSAKIQ